MMAMKFTIELDIGLLASADRSATAIDRSRDENLIVVGGPSDRRLLTTPMLRCVDPS